MPREDVEPNGPVHSFPLEEIEPAIYFFFARGFGSAFSACGSKPI